MESCSWNCSSLTLATREGYDVDIDSSILLLTSGSWNSTSTVCELGGEI